MAFVPRLSTTDPTPMQGNPWWYSNGNIYYAYGHGLPNCTAYAYGRFAEIANQLNKIACEHFDPKVGNSSCSS